MKNTKGSKPAVTIITGLSGSGKTIALRALEDSGFFSVGGLNPALISSFTSDLSKEASGGGIAIGVDVRRAEDLPVLEDAISKLRKTYNVTLIFIEAESDVLLRRYKETRRPHPLAGAETQGLEHALAEEAGMLEALRGMADRVVDTTALSPHQLRRFMADTYGVPVKDSRMGLWLMSFGYKFGIPQGLDLMFDVRFLPNPYFVPELKGLKGTDPEVREFVLINPVADEYIYRLDDFLKYLYPLYTEEGKAYLTVGVGCTGGRHRSPAIVEKLASQLGSDNSIRVNTVHRDM